MSNKGYAFKSCLCQNQLMFWFNDKMIEDNHHETNVIGRSNFMAFINFFFLKIFSKEEFKRAQLGHLLRK